MSHESRVKKSLLNARVNLIFYFLSLGVAFFSRKTYLDMLGADFMGLVGALQNLLSFLNLAELGIGTAIGYVLYKPLYAQDHEKINEIISVFGYFYRKIGFIILGGGVIIGCCLPFIFPDTTFPLGITYFAFFSYLTSSLLSYFINYKQTLLGADQRNYVITAYFQSAILIKMLLQMACAYYTQNYYLWISMEIVLGVAFSIILNIKINHIYPWLSSNIRLGKQLFKKYPDVMKYTKQLFIHKMGSFVQSQTVPFLIYSFVSLNIVAFYGNYTIIIDKVAQFVNNLLGSTNAGVGNLIAEGNLKNIKKVFWELMSIRFLIGGVISFSLLCLTEPFITLWLGKEYLLPNYILCLIILNTFIGYTRGATDQFLYGYGLFSDTWAPIAEICINLSTAIIGGFIWGLPGILLGGIVSLTTIIGIWKPYFLFRNGFHTPIHEYWKNYFLLLLLILLPGIGCYFFVSKDFFKPEESFINWTLYALTIGSIYGVTTFLLLYLSTPGMRSFIYRIRNRKSL